MSLVRYVFFLVAKLLRRNLDQIFFLLEQLFYTRASMLLLLCARHVCRANAVLLTIHDFQPRFCLRAQRILSEQEFEHQELAYSIPATTKYKYFCAIPHSMRVKAPYSVVPADKPKFWFLQVGNPDWKPAVALHGYGYGAIDYRETVEKVMELQTSRPENEKYQLMLLVSSELGGGERLPQSIDEEVEHVLAFKKEMDMEGCPTIGHSKGGGVALATGIREQSPVLTFNQIVPTEHGPLTYATRGLFMYLNLVRGKHGFTGQKHALSVQRRWIMRMLRHPKERMGLFLDVVDYEFPKDEYPECTMHYFSGDDELYKDQLDVIDELCGHLCGDKQRIVYLPGASHDAPILSKRATAKGILHFLDDAYKK